MRCMRSRPGLLRLLDQVPNSEMHMVLSQGNALPELQRRAPPPNMRSPMDPFAAIPENFFWMAAKGRLKPSEPLYAVQLIDAESGVHVTAAEAETLEGAIAAALDALAASKASALSSNGRERGSSDVSETPTD